MPQTFAKFKRKNMFSLEIDFNFYFYLVSHLFIFHTFEQLERVHNAINK
jgi:hypothetical protein